MKKLFKIFSLILSLLVCFQYCTVDGNGEGEENPVPTLTSISPNAKVSHMPTFTLTATGSDFVAKSVIVFNGKAKQTTYVSAAELTCQVEPDDIKSIVSPASDSMDLSGVLSKKAPVLVRNPTPGGGDSGVLDFTIHDNHTFYVSRKISGSSFQPDSAAIAVDSDGNINVVWFDSSPGNNEIFYFRSTDNGVTWSQTINLSNNTSDSGFPGIAVDSSANINVVWNDDNPGDYEIYFRRSTDDGTTWSQAVSISDNTGNSYQPIPAVDTAGNINVVWSDDTPGNYDILFSRSTDGGISWTQAVNISNSLAVSARPDLAVDSSGSISVVWHEIISGYWQVLFSRSADNGASWSQAVKISYLWGNSIHPLLAADAVGSINVAWHNDNFSNLFFSRSADNGATWSQAVNISGNLGMNYGHAVAADSAGNINFVWSDGTSGNIDIFFIRSTDNGAHWTQALNISNIPGESKWPDMAVDSAGNINVVWVSGNYLYYTGSTR